LILLCEVVEEEEVFEYEVFEEEDEGFRIRRCSFEEETRTFEDNDEVFEDVRRRRSEVFERFRDGDVGRGEVRDAPYFTEEAQ
jgi:hypothetical protein